MKLLIYILLSAIGSCATLSHKEKVENIKKSIVVSHPERIMEYLNTINAAELKSHLYRFASKEFQGREAGSEGQKKASKYLKDYYISQNIPPPIGMNQYYQIVPKISNDSGASIQSENVLAFIEGTEKPDEIIVISAHLDHEGFDNNGNVYLGADDDGSGTVALLEIAQAFNNAKNDGFGPKRSILFIHFTAEEKNLQGSKYYINNPIFPLENTISNLNADMIGRIDEIHVDNPEYVYLIGADRISEELHYISESINESFVNLNLDYRYNDESDNNRYYYRSDHYNFAKNGIPIIFYFNGEHADYHEISDTPEKINYRLLTKRTKLIFATAWQLANQKKRLSIDN